MKAPSEKELRDLSSDAKKAAYIMFYAKPTGFGDQLPSRYQMLIAEALKRWADEISASKEAKP